MSTEEKNKNLLAGIDISKTEANTTLVILPNNNQIPLKDLDFSTPAKDILNHLQAVSADNSLKLSKIDKDEVDEEKQIRVITLKTNAQRKG